MGKRVKSAPQDIMGKSGVPQYGTLMESWCHQQLDFSFLRRAWHWVTIRWQSHRFEGIAFCFKSFFCMSILFGSAAGWLIPRQTDKGH